MSFSLGTVEYIGKYKKDGMLKDGFSKVVLGFVAFIEEEKKVELVFIQPSTDSGPHVETFYLDRVEQSSISDYFLGKVKGSFSLIERFSPCDLKEFIGLEFKCIILKKYSRGKNKKLNVHLKMKQVTRLKNDVNLEIDKKYVDLMTARGRRIESKTL